MHLLISRRFVKIKTLILFFLLTLTASAQDHQQWSYNLSIYEVNVRQYTPEGTFASFETHLDRLKEMGAGILWFMPIHPIGVQNRLGSLGSYYSVKDYYAVNPEFGTLDDFKSLVTKIHQKGMYVTMDWVANHTAWDNNLTVTHPEWYSKDNNGNFIPPPGTNWTDVIDLDYTKQGLRDYMINAMKYWVTETGIDGFRCDAAGMVPLDFWYAANNQLKGLKPDLFMLVEDEESYYNGAGFDASFAWGYYGFGNGVLKRLVNGTDDANDLHSFIQSEINNYPQEHYRMYFTSNHDENSWYGTVYELFGSAAESFAVLSAVVNGIPLIYSGQEAGLNKRLLFFDKDFIPWQPHPFAGLYSKLLQLKRGNKALWNGSNGSGAIRVNTSDNTSVYSFRREKDDDKIFGVFNLTNQTKTFMITDNLYFENYIEVFNSDTVTFSPGAQFTLGSWGYKLYRKGGSISSSENIISAPDNYLLSQNYPNPFNPSTAISYSVPVKSNVTIKIFDILGNKIQTLIEEDTPAGIHKVLWNAAAIPSGVYFYQLTAVPEGRHTFIQTRKMILIK